MARTLAAKRKPLRAPSVYRATWQEPSRFSHSFLIAFSFFTHEMLQLVDGLAHEGLAGTHWTAADLGNLLVSELTILTEAEYLFFLGSEMNECCPQALLLFAA